MRKVLLIDDDEMVLMAVGQALHSRGFQVISTADGPEGVSLYMDHRPDLVLLDIGLPSFSGAEVLREIRTFDAHACIIIVTGYDTAEIRSSVARYGAYDFIQKPISAEELMRRIQPALATVTKYT